MKWTVYALVDPRNPWDYRYIGCTRRSLEERLAVHKHRIIDGIRMTIIPLESGDSDDSAAAETAWISMSRKFGAHIVNKIDIGGVYRSTQIPPKPTISPIVEKIYQEMHPWLFGGH